SQQKSTPSGNGRGATTGKLLRPSFLFLVPCANQGGLWCGLQTEEFFRSAADVTKTLAVATHLGIIPERDAHLGENARGMRLRRHNDAVMHPQSFAASRHDSRPPQIRQVPRNLGLAGL